MPPQPPQDQSLFRLSHKALHAKPGHLAVCPGLLRAAVPEMGWPVAAVTGCAQLLFLHSSPDMLGAFSAAAVLVQSALLVLSIFFTEKALKKKFGDL